MADPKRLRHAARSGWITTSCVFAVSLVLATQAFGTVTVTVETTDGVQGGSLTLTMGLIRDATDPAVASVQTDVLLDTTQLQVTGVCSNGGAVCQSSDECGTGTCVPPCQLDARLTEQSFTANLPTFPPVAVDQRRLRLAVFDDTSHPTASFDTGPLISCTFPVLTTAQANQPVSLATERLAVSGPCVLTEGQCGAGSFEPIPDAQTDLKPGTILPAPTPTRTPTPPFPCFADQDCPLGQICDPVTKVCTAATPTPTISCQTAEDCPAGFLCVDNVCQKPTPTPLPPCTTDDDCQEGLHCRAGVCVPIRECNDSDPVLDRMNCRGERETCTNGVCECGGDCNLDGYVYGNENTMMINLLNQSDISACPAGDFNGDGQIMGNEVCLAVTNLGLGCPAEGQPLIFGRDLTGQTRSLDVGSASDVPGATVTIPVSLGGEGDLQVATAQLDLIFDTNVLEIPEPETACTVDPRLTATNASFTFLPQTPSTPPGQARLRLFVGDLDLCKEGLAPPVGSFDQGPILSCTFTIKTTAPLGDSPLTAERLNIGDPQGDVFTAVSTAGMVTVVSPTPTITPTNTVTGTATGTPTLTPTVFESPTRTPTIGTPTSTVTPTGTPTLGTPTITATITPVATTPAAGGTDSDSCAIAPRGTRSGGALLWLTIPVAVVFLRRRRGS